MDLQKEREAFEKYIQTVAHPHRSPKAMFFTVNDGYGNIIYADSVIQDQWGTWQAAKDQVIPNGFVSVEDKLPIEGQDVIAFDAIKHCVFKGGEFLQGYIESDTGYEYEEPVEVTHWMTVEA